MVTGWRRAFCTSIPKEPQNQNSNNNNNSNNDNNSNSNSNSNNIRSPKLGFSKFSFFSSSLSPSPSTPSTPRGSHSQPPLSTATPKTPTLRCKTNMDQTSSPKVNYYSKSSISTSTGTSTSTSTPSSTPSSPNSPSTFAHILRTSLQFPKRARCGVCLHSVKTGQGTAIFTAECSHTFHFPCISSLAAKNNGVLSCCPLCGSVWKEAPYLATPKKEPKPIKKSLPTDLRLYDDDEPLASHISSIRFNPIPESEEENEEPEPGNDDDDDDDEFPGFFSDPATPRPLINDVNASSKGVKVTVSSESAVIAVGRSYETYAVLLTVKAPPFAARIRRPSVDVVVVLDVGIEMDDGKLQSMKRAVRGMISSLSSNDRLSMVAFSSNSKRLLPLRRMTPSGRRSARRIFDAISLASEGSCLNDALRKAAKVIQDRKEKNHFASIVIMSGYNDDKQQQQQQQQRGVVSSSTRFSEIPVHTFRMQHEFSDEEFMKCVNVFLSVVVLDVRVQFGVSSGSAAAEIAAVYSCTGRPCWMNSGSAKLGDLYSSEEREILVELKVPAASIGSHHMLSVRSYHKDPASCKQVIYGGDQALMVPRPHTMRSSDEKIQRLRSLFVMARAVAESRRLLGERNDFVGAERLLRSARAVLSQPSLKVAAAVEYRRRVEAELAEVQWRRQSEEKRREKEGSARGGAGAGSCCVVDEKGEPLTPTSAWKAAERLAKVAMMRKNLNRVSDLHGFEDARF